MHFMSWLQNVGTNSSGELSLVRGGQEPAACKQLNAKPLATDLLQTVDDVGI